MSSACFNIMNTPCSFRVCFLSEIDIFGFLRWIRTPIICADYYFYNDIIAIVLLKTAKPYPSLRTNPCSKSPERE